MFEKDTLCGLFHRQALHQDDDQRFLSSKFDRAGRLTGTYHDMTWKIVREQVLDFGRGLVSLGVEKGNRVALFSESRPWWIVADQAIQAAGGIGVPLYSTLTETELAFMIKDSGARALIVSTVDKAELALRLRQDGVPLSTVIIMEPWSGGRPDNLHTVSEIMERGRGHMSVRELEDMIDSVDPHDTASIIYTSGTTGNPKGVVLTQGNWMANVRQSSHSTLVRRQKERNLHLVHLVHLPLCHVYGRTTDYHVGGLHLGGVLVFAESYETLARDIREIRPNVIISIPRFFEKLYDTVQSRAESLSPRARALFNRAVAAGTKYAESMATGKALNQWDTLKLAVADRLVFSRIKNTAGLDRLVLGVSGGGRLPEEVCNFIRSLGIQLNEGYGLTETCAVLNFNEPEFIDLLEENLTRRDNRMIEWLVDVMVESQARGLSPFAGPLRALKLSIAYRHIGYRLRIKPGTVGRPVVDTEEKIADDGEILAKGPQVFSSYWNLPRETRESFTDDGWFKTGDIGGFDDEGFLSITDRKKDIIVTAGGKNIAPRPIEEALMSKRYIDQAMLVGDGRRYCTALIVPDFEKLALQMKGTDAGKAS
ncbi:MAG TPA: long-chain fatty acid--CoA ligase, partial [Deltaproteobacteria bacterium]|nr:long-chain fatty acid--CoA ligase [Deltaproteobacteria bacterium]